MRDTQSELARGGTVPPPPPLHQPNGSEAAQGLLTIPGMITELEAPRPPFLSRVRKGWNELMLMALSTGATAACLASMGLGVWWFAQAVLDKP